MKTNRKEYLSALLDDEAGDFERRLLYKELKDDERLREDLSRYALIRESLKTSEPLQVARPDFLQGIQAGIEDQELQALTEQAEQADQSSRQSQGTNPQAIQKTPKIPWLGYGVAAGVAAMATALSMSFLQPNMTGNNTYDSVAAAPQALQTADYTVQSANTTPVSAAASTAAIAAVPADPVVRSLYSASLDPETRKMLKRYVAQHSRYAATNTIIPSVRAVSYARDY